MSREDERFMRRALSLARRARAEDVSPNPRVGCVLVREGKVVGEGRHRRFGGPHAEAEALAAAGPRAKGATAYVTLEPCHAHPGKKTPPCAPALAKAGVARVVAAILDPHPGTAGKGAALLRRSGARVTLGVLAKKAEKLNAEFLRRIRRERPVVVLKTALSLDGRAAADGGASKWITSEKARAEARKLRASCDAVLVGVGTVLADDPSLTARLGRREPTRVILDSRLRSPARAKVFDGAAKTLVFSKAKGARRNAEIVPIDPKDLSAVLRALSLRGVGRLLVEGGPTVHAAFLSAGLVDEAAVFIAPKLLSGSRDPNRCPRIVASARRIGPDFLFQGPVKNAP